LVSLVLGHSRQDNLGYVCVPPIESCPAVR
jgi:hypothetical protein